MSKAETIKSKNLFDEEKLIDTGIKEPLFIRIPFDEYKKLLKELKCEKELRIRYERRYDKCKESEDRLKFKNWRNN